MKPVKLKAIQMYLHLSSLHIQMDSLYEHGENFDKERRENLCSKFCFRQLDKTKLTSSRKTETP